MNVPALGRRAFSLFLSHPLQFLSIAFVVVPLQAATLAADDDLWWWLSFPVSKFVSELVMGALTVAAATAASGGTPSFAGSYGVVLRRFRSILGVTVRYFGVVILLAMTVVGIPFAISRLIRWFFGIQGVVLRDLQAPEALALSSRVVMGLWWQIFGTIMLVASLVSVFWWAPLLLSWPFEVRMVIWSVVGVTVWPLVVSFYALLFLQLCERSENTAAAPPVREP